MSGSVDVLAVLRRMAGEALAFREINGAPTETRETKRDARFEEDEQAIEAVASLAAAVVDLEIAIDLPSDSPTLEGLREKARAALARVTPELKP